MLVFSRFSKLSMASQSNRPRRSYRVSNQQSVQDQPRAKWTLYLTKTLADLMVEQVYRGNRQNTSFGKKAWEYMCNEFQKKTGLNWDKEQLKNRYGVMRKQYAMVKSLLDLNDFSWDENLSMVKGKEEVWDEYIKVLFINLYGTVTMPLSSETFLSCYLGTSRCRAN